MRNEIKHKAFCIWIENEALAHAVLYSCPAELRLKMRNPEVLKPVTPHIHNHIQIMSDKTIYYTGMDVTM